MCGSCVVLASISILASLLKIRTDSKMATKLGQQEYEKKRVMAAKT